MRFLTPSRVIAAASLAVAALSFGVATAGTGSSSGTDSAARAGNKACVRGQGKLDRNKANVVAYYTTAFNHKNPELAVAKYGGPVYIQHNPQAADGFDAFIAFVKSYTQQFPQLHVDIKRVIGECNMVVTHSHITTSPDDRGNAVADFFRLNRKGKVVEHWDVIQPVPETSANDNTMF
jgi:predicted SnoaL-like aldol condensation-catalyzing enzyme